MAGFTPSTHVLTSTVFPDNEKLFFGSGDNASVYYDGTNLVIDPAEVGSGVLRIGAALVPHTTDGGALGSASLMWSDLFLASGAVINFDNGILRLTQSGRDLTLSSTGPTEFNVESTGVSQIPGIHIIDVDNGDWSWEVGRGSVDIIALRDNDANAERLRFGASGVVFNEDGNDYDFRIESNGESNFFVADAGLNTDTVGGFGIGTAPAENTFINALFLENGLVQVDHFGLSLQSSFARTPSEFAQVASDARFRLTINAANTQDWTHTVGARAVMAQLTSDALGSGTITGGAAYYVVNGSFSGATVTNLYGVYIEALTAGTNNYGVYINTPTGTIAEAIHTEGGVVNIQASTLLITNGSGTTPPNTATDGELRIFDDTDAADPGGIILAQANSLEFTFNADSQASLRLVNHYWENVERLGWTPEKVRAAYGPDAWEEVWLEATWNETRCPICGEVLETDQFIVHRVTRMEADRAGHAVAAHYHPESEPWYADLASRLEALEAVSEAERIMQLERENAELKARLAAAEGS